MNVNCMADYNCENVSIANYEEMLPTKCLKSLNINDNDIDISVNHLP